MIRRGDVCWVDFGEPRGSAPAKRRPVVIIQSDLYNASRISTAVVLPVTSNTALVRHPGNVFLPASASDLTKDSVANVSQPMTVDRSDLEETGARLPDSLMNLIDAGLRRATGL